MCDMTQLHCATSQLHEAEDNGLNDRVIWPLILRLHTSGPAAGFSPAEWRVFMKHIGALAFWGEFQGSGPLIERFRRAMPLERSMESGWAHFLYAVRAKVKTLEDKWLSSTTAINDGTKRCCESTVVEIWPSNLKPHILCSCHPVKSHGECTFVPPVLTWPSLEQAMKEHGTYAQEIAANDDGNEPSLSSEKGGLIGPPMLPASMQTDLPVRQGRQDKGLAADNKSSGYSDTKLNCSEESLEVLIGKQGAKDEANNKVVTLDEEKEDNKDCCPRWTGRPVSR
jgi:hypothetical protein